MSLPAANDFFRTGNYLEAALWITVAGVFAVLAARRQGTVRRRCALATVTFFLFGLSDIVEVRTGAWWRPWWLLAWKATCVLAMLWLLWRHMRDRR